MGGSHDIRHRSLSPVIFSQGKRSFMQLLKKLSLIMVVLLAFSLLAGCGGGFVDQATAWDTVSVSGTVLRYQVNNIPATALNNPLVLALGKTNEATVLAKTEEVTGKTEAQAVELLRSYDTTGSRVVRILQLREDLYVTRYWGSSDAKLGRWYTPSEVNHLYLPQEARKIFALPDSNSAYCVSLYRLKSGVIVLDGVCADMTWNYPTFGVYATGGGGQFYAPQATKWVVDHAELDPTNIQLLSELRYPTP
jgi:hypothetical protein